MKTKKYCCAFLILLIIASLILSGCSPAKKPNYSKKIDIPKQSEKKKNDQSGLPWENDPAFLKAKRENNTPIRISSFNATLPDPILHERDNISRAADYLAGAVVNPGEVFSLNSRIGQRTAKRGFQPGPMYSDGHLVTTMGGGVCKIASVMYNAAVLADQKVVERFPHSMTVPYVPPGQDATVSYGTKDFKFKNTSGAPILIWAKNQGGTLYIAFYGSVPPPQVTWVHQVLSRTPSWTEKINDPSLPKGTEKELFEGSPGISVHSWVIVTKDSKKTKKDMGISSYRPAARVVVRNK